MSPNQRREEWLASDLRWIIREREVSFGFSTEAMVGDLGKCSFSGLRCQVDHTK